MDKQKKVEETQKVGFFHPFRDCFVSYQKVDKKSFFYPSNIEFAFYLLTQALITPLTSYKRQIHHCPAIDKQSEREWKKQALF